MVKWVNNKTLFTLFFRTDRHTGRPKEISTRKRVLNSDLWTCHVSPRYSWTEVNFEKNKSIWKYTGYFIACCTYSNRYLLSFVLIKVWKGSYTISNDTFVLVMFLYFTITHKTSCQHQIQLIHKMVLWMTSKKMSKKTFHYLYIFHDICYDCLARTTTDLLDLMRIWLCLIHLVNSSPEMTSNRKQ